MSSVRLRPKDMMIANADAVAIVGIACRFPGGADSPAAFWRLLCDAGDAIREIPADRFDLRKIFDRDPSQPGRQYTRRGGFIDHVDRFDAGFFGISPREAKHIDPQQRLLLELAWEAIEDAGLRVDTLAGTATGVFIGISTHDYGDVQTYPEHRHLIGSHTNTGTATSLAANRISYLFDFRGPSLIVDTACSSSLTAVHLACQSLRNRDCRVAVVGGVQLQLTAEPTIGFCKASMLSPDGQCRAFDAGANGYVRSEGGGVVILRPLAEAVADGDSIYAVIRGSAINQDGHTTGMTVPSAAAQEALLRAALANANLGAGDVDYVEAHGTGTPVGDPIEAAALGAVLSEGLAAGRSCPIGSVKTNIGHLEAASGMAGLIKAALAIRHRTIPPSLHFESPNPAIDFERLRLRVVTSLEPWPETGAPAVAGVNGFGFGGANAHIVLQEHTAPPTPAPSPANVAGERAEALVLSARSEAALVSLARAHMTLLEGGEPLPAICATAALRRTPLAHRVAIVGTRSEMMDGLDAFIASERRASVSSARVAAGGIGPLAFVFCGMGPQWWAMGRELLRDEPVFRNTIERCAAALPRAAGWSLMDEFQAEEHVSRLGDPAVAQVAGFALQAALAEWLRSLGIVAGAVVGHSAGEMAAAFVSGALTLEACVELAWHRSRLQAIAAPGRMIAAALSEDAARHLIETGGGHLSLAAVNSPSSVTLSGDRGEIVALHERLQQQQVFSRVIPFPVAYHSAHMDGIQRELLDSLGSLAPAAGAIPMVSTVTGSPIDGRELGASYWWRNVREPVRFGAAMAGLIADGYRTFLELGPHPVLAASMAECLAAADESATLLATLRRKENERAAMLRAVGGLYVRGYPVNWAGLFGTTWTPVTLPSYPWDRERHWVDAAPQTVVHVAPPEAGDVHPLLGRRLDTANATWDASLAHEGTEYLDDHVVQGAVVFPGVGYLEMAAAAVQQLRPGGGVTLRDVAFVSPLFAGPGRTPRVQLTVDRDGRFEVQSLSSADGAWTLHAHGRTVAHREPGPTVVDLRAIRERCETELSRADCYAQFGARGLMYGPAFRGIQTLSTGHDEALGRIAFAEPLSRAGDYTAHPAVFDSALQVLIGAAAPAQRDDGAHLFLPVGIHEVSYRQRVTGGVWSYARVTARHGRHVTGDVHLVDDEGTVLVSVRGLRCQLVEAAGAAAAESIGDWLYEDHWEPMPLAGGHAATSAVRLHAADLQQEADRLSETSPLDQYYREVEPALDALARAYVARAVEALGWRLTAGTRITSASVDAVVPASRRPFARRLLSFLETSGVLRAESDGHTVIAAATEGDPAALSFAARGAWPQYRVYLDLLDRCGVSLADNLRGSRSGQEVLFADDGFAMIEAFYREAPPSMFYNGLAARVAASLASQVPAGQPLRILEVGAGTGGTTAALLPLLTRAPDTYVFTDVSRRFLDAAKTAFASFPFLSTAVCDLEADSLDDVPAGGFDIVLAANVVHATANVAHALGRIQALLAPGGLFVLLEITRPTMWLDIVFGLTDAWWQFQDRVVRPGHALMDGARWEALLKHTGFADVLSVADSVHPAEAAQRVFVARAPGHARSADATAKRWVILADERGVATRLEACLARAGAGCTIVAPGDRLDRVLADGRPVDGIIHLRSLDIEEADTGDALLASQRVGCGSAVAAVQALAGISRPPALCLITAGGQPDPSGVGALSLGQSALWGLGRVIMRERPELRCRLIDIGPGLTDEDVDALGREVLSGDDEEEVAFRRGARFVRRLHRAPGTPDQAAERRPPLPNEEWSAHIGTPGALQTLEFRPHPSAALAADQVAVRIAAASINFRDVMLAMGTIPGLEQETTLGSRRLGLDAAGTVVSCGRDAGRFKPGDCVMGIVPGAFGSDAVTVEALLTLKPDRLDFEQASSVPCVFVTAHYALNHLARLRQGERVLIHSATGGVGLAAIQVARDVGAEIFATAGSPDKRTYLESLGIRHVMDSRSIEFADEIMRITDGEGVDVVLNSLPGAALAAGVRVLRPFGRFLEIGKRDIYENAALGLLPFRKNLSFHAIDLDRLCVERPALVGVLLREVADRLESGQLQPLPQQVWPISQMEDAMRFMAQARHTGKIVLSVEDPRVVLSAPPATAPLVKASASYLVTGGLGGFGLAVAERLVRGGAGAVVLAGRRAPSDEIQQRLDVMRRASGARVDVMLADVSRADDVARVLNHVRGELPPLAGVVHAAMVLDDGSLDQMGWPQFERVLAPKMAGAWHLHTQTAKDALDFFVMFSSIAARFGNLYQGNYAAANAYLDALAHDRRARGMPGLSVEWGVLAEVGYVAGRPELFQYLARQGYQVFSPEQALDVLDVALRQQRTTVMAARVDWTRWATASPTGAMSRRFGGFAAVLPHPSGGSQRSSATAAAVDLSDPEMRHERLEAYLRQKIARVLGASPASIEGDKPLTEFGLDSLIAVELMTAIRVDLGVEVPVVKLLDGITMNGLAALALLTHARGSAPAEGSVSTWQPTHSATPASTTIAATEAAAVEPIVDVPAPEPTPEASVSASNGEETRPTHGDGEGTPWSPRQRVARFCVSGVMRALTRVSVEGLDRLPTHGPAVLALNHLSAMDVPLALAVLPRRAIMLAKNDLRRWHLVDWLLSDIGDTIYVKRGEGDAGALERALAVLRQGGIVALAPEGRRNPGGLTRGHSGVSYLATRAGVPIVPMAAWGQAQLGRSWRTLRRAPIQVRFGPPIVFPAAAPTALDLREYTDVVMRAIAAQLPAEYRGIYGDGQEHR